jgi:hypothetical protein
MVAVLGMRLPQEARSASQSCLAGPTGRTGPKRTDVPMNPITGG